MTAEGGQERVKGEGRFTVIVCPEHGPFIWIGNEGDDWSRRACPTIVDYDGITCDYGTHSKPPVEMFEVERVKDA
jgi:hypothetical protein